MTHHRHHAVVLLPGSAAAEEGNEENHHADDDEKDGSSWRCGVIDHERLVQRHLDQDSHHNQGKATYLQTNTGHVVSQGRNFGDHILLKTFLIFNLKTGTPNTNLTTAQSGWQSQPLTTYPQAKLALFTKLISISLHKQKLICRDRNGIQKATKSWECSEWKKRKCRRKFKKKFSF